MMHKFQLDWRNIGRMYAVGIGMRRLLSPSPDIWIFHPCYVAVVFSKKTRWTGYVDDLYHTYIGNSVHTKTDDPNVLHTISSQIQIARILHNITVVLGI